MASRAAEQMHGVRHAGVLVDTYPLPVGFVLQAWRTPAVKGRLEVGQRALTSCDPPPQTNLPAAPGQRGAGHQQLHIREGLKFFFSNSHIVMAIHQSSPCEQWEPLEGAESVRRGNKSWWVRGCFLPRRHCAPAEDLSLVLRATVNLGSALTRRAGLGNTAVLGHGT